MLKRSFLLILFIVLPGFGNAQDIHAFCFYSMLPELKDGKLLFADSTASFIFYKKDLVLYKLSSKFIPDLTVPDSSEQRYVYFVVQADSTYGYFFRQGAEQGIRQQRDSTINLYSMLLKVFFDKKIHKMNPQLIAAVYNTDSSCLSLTYNFRLKGDTAIVASGMLKFTEDVGSITYSMSHSADSLSKAFPPDRPRKTAELKVEFRPWTDQQTKLKQDSFTLRYWLLPWKQFDDAEINQYFNHYQQMIKTKNMFKIPNHSF